MNEARAGRSDGARSGRRQHKAAAQREREILDAAIRVFADKGYHSARISDIAAEAGVAYGLVYHYFSGKEQLLETIFQRTWSHLVQGLRDIEAGEGSSADKIAAVVRLMLGSYRLAPDLVRVLILEVTRSGTLRHQVDEISQGFVVLEQIIRSGQQTGEFRALADASLLSYVFWGAIDEVLTGWVFATLPSTDADVTAAERAIVELILGGMVGSEQRPDA